MALFSFPNYIFIYLCFNSTSSQKDTPNRILFTVGLNLKILNYNVFVDMAKDADDDVP